MKIRSRFSHAVTLAMRQWKVSSSWVLCSLLLSGLSFCPLGLPFVHTALWEPTCDVSEGSRLPWDCWIGASWEKDTDEPTPEIPHPAQLAAKMGLGVTAFMGHVSEAPSDRLVSLEQWVTPYWMWVHPLAFRGAPTFCELVGCNPVVGDGIHRIQMPSPQPLLTSSERNGQGWFCFTRRLPSDDHLMQLTDFTAYTCDVTCLSGYKQQSIIHSTRMYESPYCTLSSALDTWHVSRQARWKSLMLGLTSW